MADIRSYFMPTALAVGMHAVLIYLASGAWFEQHHSPRIQRFQHVNAELIDLKAINADKARKEAERKRQLEAKKQAEAKKKADARKKADAKKKAEAKRQAEQRRQKQLKKEKLAKAAAEKKRRAEAKKRAEKKAAEAKRIALEKKRKEEAARKQRELAKRKAEAMKQRQAEERQRQEELARRQREEALAEAAAREEAERQRQVREAEVVASAQALITRVVSSYWSRPPSARNGMRVEIRIHLLPSGEVDDAYVTKASGDEAFDRSAVNAVFKAEKFPELQTIDPVTFDRNLRTITMIFRPEDLRL